MTDIPGLFAGRLRELRQAKQMTQSDLGQLLGSGKVQISRYESGAFLPNASTLVRIADLFDCSVDYLLGRTGTMRGEGRLPDYSPEETSIIEAIRQKRYVRLMHYLGILFEMEEKESVHHRARNLKRAIESTAFLDSNECAAPIRSTRTKSSDG